MANFTEDATNFSLASTSTYHADEVQTKRPGPGLVKTKRAPLIESRVRRWIRCTDYRWRELFEKADIVSEGAVRLDADGPTYYGSTHIRLFALLGERPFTSNEIAELNRLIRNDLHVRLRAIRLACLEAQVRARTELASVRTEISFTDDPETVSLSVDIAAKLSNGADVGHRRTASHRGR